VIGPGVVAGRLQRAGDAEVDDLDAAQCEQHVPGLEVPMDHTGAVDRGQRGGDAHRRTVQVCQGQRPVLMHHVGEIRPVDVLHHQVRRIVVGIGVQYLGGAERRHLAGPVDLAAEAPPEPVVAGVLGADHLDRHRPPARILREVHGAHAALAQTADERVRTQPGGVVGKEGCSHVGSARPIVGGKIGWHVTARM
jgi:hypothetical protein